MSKFEGGRRISYGTLSERPLVSIITVVFRAAKELPPLLESIIKNKGQDCELIVIDGGSDDGTLGVLRSYGDAIDYWLSEPDRGIYDAMNKGLAAATGQFVLHLNAGDRLLSIPRRQLRVCLANRVDVACFSVVVENWGEFHPRTGFLLKIDNTWHHQGTFYRRQLHPGYDLRYRVFSDFDCNQKLMKAGRSVALFRDVVAEQFSVGVSRDATHEVYEVIASNFGPHYAVLRFLWGSLERPRLYLKRLLTWYEKRLKRR